MNEQEANVVAALMARSNYGQLPPDEGVVRRLWAQAQEEGKLTLQDAVDSIVGELCESDDHFDMFHDEAKGWKVEALASTLEEIKGRYHSLGQTLSWAESAPAGE